MTKVPRFVPIACVLLGCSLIACHGREARQLRNEIQDDDYRSTYARAPGLQSGRTPAQGGPHGGFIDVYINEVMTDAIAEAQASGEVPQQWPEGSIIVKDGWSALSGGDFEYLSFMERREDGWFWGEYRRGKRLISAGLDDSTCTGCHASGEDEVLLFELPPYTE
ncbi:MAG: cytochrome P460 family protein [Nannocystaceae bacterium]|nr:cytochrome P460 family protein [Nannocystaceae bacterium]